MAMLASILFELAKAAPFQPSSSIGAAPRRQSPVIFADLTAPLCEIAAAQPKTTRPIPGEGPFSTPLVSMESLSTVQPLNFATGGHVSGPGGPKSDFVPAMLSNGEFVVNAMDARRNRPILEAINAGRAMKMPHLAAGGFVGFNSATRNMRAPQTGGLTFNGDIIVQGGGSREESRRTGKQVAASMQREIAKASRMGVAA